MIWMNVIVVFSIEIDVVVALHHLAGARIQT
jgi:hypothetical protein